jgi:hypothetical protein
MANDTDTLMVASAMATDLARGPVKAAVKAPTTAALVATSAKATDADSTNKQTSSSSKNVEKGARLEDVTDSTSFLAGVLARVGQAELSRGGGSNSMGLGNGNYGKGQFASTDMETPSKRARRLSLSTPTGLSPPLQASPPSTSTSASISSLAQGSSHRIFAGTPGKSLFGENGTLMENDLEAISALNLLGNSPATMNGSDKRASDAGGGIDASPRKSLFAQVVQGATMSASAPDPLPATQQGKKRKLRF